MTEETQYSPAYDTVDVESATVLSVIPYTEGAEYREYNVSGEELPHLLQTIDDPQVAERVVSVDVVRE